MDIMEHVGFDPNSDHCSIHTSAYNHTRNTKTSSTLVNTGATDDFAYRIDWTPHAVKGFVDDVQYFQFINENSGSTWPFNKKFYLILNIAVGGKLGRRTGSGYNSAFPTTMGVDYVKVFKMIE